MTKKDYFEFAKDFFSKCLKISEKKNADYTGIATDPFANFTAVEAININTVDGFLTRMMDKMQRVSSFNKLGQLQVKDESVTDTLSDLANYSCLLAGYIKSREVVPVKEAPPMYDPERYNELRRKHYAHRDQLIAKIDFASGENFDGPVAKSVQDEPRMWHEEKTERKPIDKELKPLRFGKAGEPFLTEDLTYKAGLKQPFNTKEQKDAMNKAGVELFKTLDEYVLPYLKKDVFIPATSNESYVFRHFFPEAECGTWNNIKVIRFPSGVLMPDNAKDDIGKGPGAAMYQTNTQK